MRLTSPRRFWISPWRLSINAGRTKQPPLIRIQNGTFYRQQPSSNSKEDPTHNPSLYPNLTFEYPANNGSGQYCAIVGPSNAGKTTFLNILRGQHLCFPPAARSYPYLNSEELLQKDARLSYPTNAIHYVGFGQSRSSAGSANTYLSARYESRREATDFTLLDFLLGRTQLNALEDGDSSHDKQHLKTVCNDLKLGNLLDMPFGNLSNGQTRRARIAKALLGKPELLLLDEPFMGLDPPTTTQLNPLLRNIAYSASPRLFLALRPQDPIPDWITRILYVGQDMRITHQGSVSEVLESLESDIDSVVSSDTKKDKQLLELPRYNKEFGRTLTDDGILIPKVRLNLRDQEKYERAKARWNEGDRREVVRKGLGLGEGHNFANRKNFRKYGFETEPPLGEALVEMSGVAVKYGDKAVLGNWDQQYEMHVIPTGNRGSRGKFKEKPMLLNFDSSASTRNGLHWAVHRGQRWAIIGPNGSGKTTLLSLITSDHPQAYSLPLKLFGRSRLPSVGQPGISVFDIQRRIGHASPEVHNFFPKHLTVRQALESAYADTPLSPARMDADTDARIAACLRWFQGDLNPAVGPNPLLQREMLSTEEVPAMDYAKPGHEEYYQAKQAEHFYIFDEEQESALEWADEMRFGEMTLSGQRVALFLRAIVAEPDIVILDEAFSGMDDVVRDKCLLFLEAGETKRLTPFRRQKQVSGILSKSGLGEADRTFPEMRATGITIEGTLMKDHQALVCVSHVREEIPRCVSGWLYLPEGEGQGVNEELEPPPSTPKRRRRAKEFPSFADSKPREPRPVFATGRRREASMDSDPALWQDIWNIPMLPRRAATEQEQEERQQGKAVGGTQLAALEADRKPRKSKSSTPENPGDDEAVEKNARKGGRTKGQRGLHSREPILPRKDGWRKDRSAPTLGASEDKVEEENSGENSK